MVLLEIVEFSKLALSVAVWCYVYFFLRNTEDHIERRPWEYLYIACMVLFLFEMISFLQIFRARAFGAEFFDRVKGLLEFAFLGFLLFAFLSQHRLLVKEKLIVITKAQPKGLHDEGHDRKEDIDEQEELNSQIKKEQKEEAIFERKMAEIPQSTNDPVRDEEFEQLVLKARGVAEQSEQLLLNANQADPVKVALFRDELEDLKIALEDPSCTKERLRKKVTSIMGSD